MCDSCRAQSGFEFKQLYKSRDTWLHCDMKTTAPFRDTQRSTVWRVPVPRQACTGCSPETKTQKELGSGSSWSPSQWPKGPPSSLGHGFPGCQAKLFTCTKKFALPSLEAKREATFICLKKGTNPIASPLVYQSCHHGYACAMPHVLTGPSLMLPKQGSFRSEAASLSDRIRSEPH